MKTMINNSSHQKYHPPVNTKKKQENNFTRHNFDKFHNNFQPSNIL